LRRADAALYEAKRIGGDQVQVAGLSLHINA
jgi:GGDEF domain-containing protein